MLTKTSTLWVEERDKAVWHRAVDRVDPRRYIMACGWELSLHDGRVWPQKGYEVGPPEDEQCVDCRSSR